MADNLDSLENFLSCQVCFHDFREDGDHIPRLLPCEACLKQLIRNDKLECPDVEKLMRQRVLRISHKISISLAK